MKGAFSCLAAALLLIFALATIPVAQATTFWVGAEDLSLQNGDKDYNDLVFNMSGLGLMVRGAGVWMPMVTPNDDGTPYWDNTSWDGGTVGWNIGYFVTATGNFAGNPNSPALSVAQLQYWGLGAGYDTNVSFFSTGGIGSTILAEVAGYSGSNALYWFPVNNPSAQALIFSGSNGVGTSVSFNPGGDFGLLLVSPGGTYSSVGNGGNFAVFGEVPEVTTLLLLGSGLAALGLFRRRTGQCRIAT